MTEENWVKLPEPPPLTLPSETVLRYPHGVLWCAQEELVLVGSCEYRGELRRGKQTVAGATFQTLQVKLPPGYRFEGSEVVKEEKKPAPAYCTFEQAWASRQNQAEQQRGSGIESPLARAVREQIAQAEAYTAQVCQRQGQLQYGTCPECSQQCWIQLSQVCAACGATAKSIEAKRARPACKCGATENVRVVQIKSTEVIAGMMTERTEHRRTCAPCYQTQRRAELQAQQLKQTKRDMNRPVKRDPYEWLGFSSADWEE